MSRQLELFGGPSGAADPVHAEAAAIAARVPALVRFGTSSWSFPGWRGLVYSDRLDAPRIARDGLREYARHPLLRTVGIDRSYYAPIPDLDLAHYASQLPDGFVACFKAPRAVTARVRYGPGGRAEGDNPDFLSVARLSADLLEPAQRAFRRHTGPILLEFPPAPRGVALDAARFAEDLDGFLAALPAGFRYAVELRDRALLTADYARVLTSRGVAHVYNYWSAMPMPADQADVVPIADLPFAVVRLLLRPGTWYEDQRDRFRPFNRLVAPDPLMRRQVVTLAGHAIGAGRELFVLVNNKAEGSSPLTIAALARLLTSLENSQLPTPNSQVGR